MAVQLVVPDNTHRPLNTGDGTEFGSSPSSVISALNTFLGGTVQAGTSTTGTFGVCGNITKSLTTIGSSATNTTQTLISYTLPANSLAATGNGVAITAWGRKANNAAGVTFQLNAGGTNINSGNIATSGGISWLFEAYYYASGAATQQAIYQGQTSSSPLPVKSTSDTSTSAAAIVISMQALDASAAQSNVLLDGFVVEYFQ